MLLTNATQSLVGDELEGSGEKWWGTVAGANGCCLYGIPYDARRVVKFNSVDKSITYIGPDFGDNSRKWRTGVLAPSNGIIYSFPWSQYNQYIQSISILKIDTNTDTVSVLNVELPEQTGACTWASKGALGLDGCMYYMPINSKRILKFDPSDDSLATIGDYLRELLGDQDYSGAVTGIDGCLYGLPYRAKRILKYDPINDVTSFLGQEFDRPRFSGGALGRDGHIYAAVTSPWLEPALLRIDTKNNTSFMLKVDLPIHNDQRDAVVGNDGCIYWPPSTSKFIIKYDPRTKHTSAVVLHTKTYVDKWKGGALASDGVIYCLPCSARNVLCIDPLKEYTLTLKKNMEEHLDEFGFLFRINYDIFSIMTNIAPQIKQRVFEVLRYHMNIPVKEIQFLLEDDHPSIDFIKFERLVSKVGKLKVYNVLKDWMYQFQLDSVFHDINEEVPKETNFDHAISKFGRLKVFEILEQSMPPMDQVCSVSNLYPFMIAASCENTTVPVIYHLFRQCPSSTNCINRIRHVSNVEHCHVPNISGRKRKYSAFLDNE